MALIKEYFELTKKYQNDYGDNTILLMQVGSFFEVYGICDKKTNIITGKGAYAASYLIESNFTLLENIPTTDEINGLKTGYAFFCRIIS